MRTIKEKIETHLDVREEISMYGIACDGITVLEGGSLHLYGMCNSELAVVGGGQAFVYGMVNGDVINDSKITISGVVNGKVFGPGKTIVNDGAIITGGVDGGG